MTGLSEEAGIAAAFALAAWAISDRIRRFMNRGSSYPVSALSDRQLNDIGLISTDFRWAVRQPLHIDASDELDHIVCERVWAEDSGRLKRQGRHGKRGLRVTCRDPSPPWRDA